MYYLPIAMIDLFLTARRGLASCGNNADMMDGWNDTRTAEIKEEVQ